MKKIVLLPMDERPCNYKFPKHLFENEEIQIIEPQTLGFKKDGADYNIIKDFLCKECKNAYGLIISIIPVLIVFIVCQKNYIEAVSGAVKG